MYGKEHSKGQAHEMQWNISPVSMQFRITYIWSESLMAVLSKFIPLYSYYLTHSVTPTPSLTHSSLTHSLPDTLPP